MKKLYCVFGSNYRKFEKLEVSYLLEKTLVLSIICIKYKNKNEKKIKEEESTEILKILGLINNIEDYQKYKIIKVKKNRWSKKLLNWRNKLK